MQVKLWKVTKLRTSKGELVKTLTSDETYLHTGYNEFYLPSVDLNSELWIEIEDEYGKTTLHLKR